MARFKSELSWSVSRDRLFNECRRAYYYNYYASWGGWDKKSDEFTRKAYILKNIRNIDAWIGDIVHQIIKWIISSKLYGNVITLDDARKKSKQMLMRTWEQSRSQEWKKNIKNNLNLFEHYYNCEPERVVLMEKMQKVVNSLRNFYNSGLMEFFLKLPKENFLTIDELDSFLFKGTKVFAVPDFAVREEQYIIYDWKTGKPYDKDVFQLSFYKMYAESKWKASPENIKLIPVYLGSEEVSLTPVSAVPLEEIKTYIVNSIKDMKSVLYDIENNLANIELCAKTENAWTCKRCKFQEICS